MEVNEEDQLAEARAQMRDGDGPSFLRAPVSAQTEVVPPRVSRLPDEIARTFRKSIAQDEV